MRNLFGDSSKARLNRTSYFKSNVLVGIAAIAVDGTNFTFIVRAEGTLNPSDFFIASQNFGN